MKKTACLFTVLLILSSTIISAKDLATAEGVVYKDVTITETTPIGLSFISHGKAGWLDFRDMTPELQKEYGYDPAKADEFEQKLVKNNGNMVPADGAPDMQGIPAEANLDPQTVPQTADNTVTVTPTQQVNYDPTYFPSAAPVNYGGYVNWNGNNYPYYWWHNWYWNHNWAYHNGRYYPWNYYHNHGTWYHGKYYPYHHGLLQPQERCQEKTAHSMAQHPQPKKGQLEGHVNRNPAARSGGAPHPSGHSGGGAHGGGGGHR